MKGNSRVLAHLQRLLASELALADQLLVHGRTLQGRGLRRLAEPTLAAAQAHRARVDQVVQRMLALGTTPDLAQREPLQIGDTPREMLRHDLDGELDLISTLRTAIVCAQEERDFETARLIGTLLATTEGGYTLWLEAQLALMDGLGTEVYLATQL